MQVRMMRTEVKKTQRGHEMHQLRPHVSFPFDFFFFFFKYTFNNQTILKANLRIRKLTRNEGKVLKQKKVMNMIRMK